MTITATVLEEIGVKNELAELRLRYIKLLWYSLPPICVLGVRSPVPLEISFVSSSGSVGESIALILNRPSPLILGIIA